MPKMDKLFFSTLLICLTTVLSKSEVAKSQKSIEEYTVIYAQKNSTLGPDHRETQVSLNDLARAYKLRGDFDTALKMFRQLLEISTKVFGAEDMETSDFRQDVANLLLAQKKELNRPVDKNVRALLRSHKGKNLEAMDLFKINYKIRTAKLGPDNPSVLDALLGMAHVNLALENYAQASIQYQQVYEGQKLEFGAFHQKPIEILDGLALTLALQSQNQPEKWEDAVKMFKIIYEFRQKTLNTDDVPGKIFRLNSAASQLAINGDHEKAFQIWQILYRIQSQVFHNGKNDESIIRTLVKMAEERIQQKRFDEALQILRDQALPKSLQLYPNDPDHESHLDIMTRMALVHFESGDLKEAARIYGKVYEKEKTNLGLEDPRTVTTFGKLFQVLQQQKDYQGISQLAKEIYDHALAKYGQDHEKTIEARHDLAKTYFDNDRLPEALELFEQNLRIQKKSLGRHHEDTKYSRGIVQMVKDKVRQNKASKIRKDGGRQEL